ncbi:unnamed protein product [Ectocarpus sp. 12 AP-2014]
MGGASEDLSSTSAGGTGIGHRGGGGGNKSSSRGGGCDGPGVPRRRRGLSWMAQTCSTAARSFDWWGAASDPSVGIGLGSLCRGPEWRRQRRQQQQHRGHENPRAHVSLERDGGHHVIFTAGRGRDRGGFRLGSVLLYNPLLCGRGVVVVVVTWTAAWASSATAAATKS